MGAGMRWDGGGGRAPRVRIHPSARIPRVIGTLGHHPLWMLAIACLPDQLPSASLPVQMHPAACPASAKWSRANSMQAPEQPLSSSVVATSASLTAAALASKLHRERGPQQLRSSLACLTAPSGPWCDLRKSAIAVLTHVLDGKVLATADRSSWQAGKADAAWQDAGEVAEAAPAVPPTNGSGAAPPEPGKTRSIPTSFSLQSVALASDLVEPPPRLRLARASMAMGGCSGQDSLPAASTAHAAVPAPSKKRNASAPPQCSKAAACGTIFRERADLRDGWGLPDTASTPEDHFAKPKSGQVGSPIAMKTLSVTKPSNIGWASPPRVLHASARLDDSGSDAGKMPRSTSHSALSAALAMLKLPPGASPPPLLCSSDGRPRFASHPNLVSLAAIKTTGADGDHLVL